jgi:hypothetical protein
VTGAEVLWILLMAFLVVLVANGLLVYIATDSNSSLRELLESLC